MCSKSFEPGIVGFTVDWRQEANISAVREGTQAAAHGVQPGWKMYSINDEPASSKILKKKREGKDTYCITFSVAGKTNVEGATADATGEADAHIPNSEPYEIECKRENESVEKDKEQQDAPKKKRKNRARNRIVQEQASEETYKKHIIVLMQAVRLTKNEYGSGWIPPQDFNLMRRCSRAIAAIIAKYSVGGAEQSEEGIEIADKFIDALCEEAHSKIENVHWRDFDGDKFEQAVQSALAFANHGAGQ